jgi:superfamily I DNA and/or RNA helicase/very-short-patch-repair endonuclease
MTAGGIIVAMNINDKLEFWKKRLLDLGKRNRLINCPLPSDVKRIQRHSLLICLPSSIDLWTLLNENDGVVEFPIPDEFQEDQDETGQLVLSEDDAFEDDYDESVRTNQSIKEANKTLLSLMKKAKVFNEEKGLNALHLAFGFLNWKENGTTGQDMRSPLLLLPVKLEQEDLFKPIILSSSDEEITPNHSLAQKLLSDFNITLPPYSEDIKFADYISEVQHAVKGMGWSVSVDVTQLSLFSFMKVNMYRDLEKNAGTICSHSIVRAINGEIMSNTADVSNINGYNHDSTPLQEVFSVVDADASQQDAILLAKRGASFVLQGPPGTGKSQTITNIIAELLADGKKVLFVSEKMAALEVVYKRLSQVGLADFCLTLHSHNAKRREVLDQFEKSIKRSRTKIQIQQDAFSVLTHLKENRDALNLYNEQLHAVVEPLGKTIFQVNGLLSALEDNQNIDYVQSNAADFTPEMFAQCESALSELARVVGKSGYQDNNPWNGCVLTKPPTFEFRQRFLTDAEKLTKALNTGMTLLSVLKAIIGTSINEWSYSDMLWLNEINDCVKRSPKVDSAWLGVSLPVAISNLDTYNSVVNKKKKLTDEKQSAKQQIASVFEQLKTCEESSLREQNLLIEAEAKSKIAHQSLTERCDEKVLNIDAAEMLVRYRSKYRSWTRLFSIAYMKDRKVLLSYCKKAEKLPYEEGLLLLDQIEKTLSLSVAYSKQVELVNAANALLDSTKRQHLELTHHLQQINNLLVTVESEIEAAKTGLVSAFGSVITDSKSISAYINENMDFADFRKKLEWCSEFNELQKRYNFGGDFVSAVCCGDTGVISGLNVKTALINKWSAAIKPMIYGFASLFDDRRKQSLSGISITQLLSHVKNCKENFSALENLIDYRIANERLKALGIAAFLDKAKQMNLDADTIIDVFNKCFYRSWLDAVEPKFPAINEFRRLRQDDRVKSFMKLDREQLDVSKVMLLSRLVSHLPNFDAFSTSGEMALLRREMAKQRKLMPTRLLIANLPNLLPALKPCMMMSPLSVSTYLGSSNYEFDTVIFDEASQVRTEDAIGAIFRAKQAIIAGDSKQLPPTDFFSSSMSADDDYEEDDDGIANDAGAYESLLDEATLLPTQTLLWHYRSRDEHLIAFSNAKIYKGSLTTFPSSIEKAPGMGVEYVLVSDGTYDRGGKNGNKAEAEKVAELVFDHFRDYPKRSLGVIAFGEVQQSAIQDALILKRRQNSAFEPFFKEDKDESLFIKNLETVQGDERDTIIFSIGYAPDAAGKFIMNFGPFSREGGERRLNVAVTRARYNLKLVSSIEPTDIKVENVSGQGPKLLRQYIDFAKNGERAILGEISANDEVWFDSPFETSVYNFLTSNGYDVATQVGCSGYRIDMAVRHPTYNGRFALGVECDGAMYHSARTARERDRLRQTVLEDMGWQMYRIWSTDWIKDRHTEGERLLNAVRLSVETYHEAAPSPTPRSSNLSDLVVVETQSESEHRMKGLQEKSRILRSGYYGWNAKDIPPKDFADVMLKVVQNTIGLNKTEVFKETALFGYGWERMGSVIKEKLELSFKNLIDRKLIEFDQYEKVNIIYYSHTT